MSRFMERTHTTDTKASPACVRCGQAILGPNYYSDIMGNGPWCPPCFQELQNEEYERRWSAAALGEDP
jgi:hypothetical protein